MGTRIGIRPPTTWSKITSRISLWQYVRRITCPTIYVLGGRSTIVPPETQEQIKRTIPGVEIVTMPGLGHYPDQESPDAFVAIAERFLAAHR